jgi:hypothetical protein
VPGQRCDTVLRGQGHHTPQGAVTDKYGAMVELCLGGKIVEAWGKSCSSSISSIMNFA